MFPTTLDVKNANKVQKKIFQNSTKDRMTRFNVSVVVKCRREELVEFFSY